MASLDAAPTSQHSQLAAPQPFRFLDLPSEIRNKAYDSILCDREPNVRLKKVEQGTDMKHNFFGLANVNRQLRAEFGPLRMSNMGYIVPLIHYSAFVATFFRPISRYPRPLRVRIEIGLSQVGHDFSWDMKPLMLAKATTPGLHLIVTRVPYEYPSDYRFNYMLNIAWLVGGSNSGIYGPRKALLRDVKPGYISDIHFKWIDT
jgi:hypothetical protein